MKKKPAEPTRGGARKGAGKKPKVGPLRVTKSFTCEIDTAEYLATLPNAAKEIETLIRRSASFKRWKAVNVN